MLNIMIIKNYNSTESLDNYNLGEVYTFFIHDLNVSTLDEANKETINKYSSSILNIINDNDFDTGHDGRWLSFTRVIGVVVEKQKKKNENEKDTITVMFKTDDNYLLNEYVVNSYNIITNEKDNIPPAAVLCTA